MATFKNPLPPPSIPWIDKPGTPSLSFRQYFLALDAAVRALFAAVSGNVGPPLTLTAVTTPNNANAAAAGVAIGQLYMSTADPHIVYVRTA
jgi:hypothetical protein